MIENDSREKLEADVRSSLGFTTKDVIEWLDRQAAITERELENNFLDRANDVITRRELVQRELQRKVDELKAESDDNSRGWTRAINGWAKASAEVDRLIAENTKIKKTIGEIGHNRDCERLQRENNNLAHDLGDCMAERDQLREIIGKMVDAAHELTRLAALYE